MDQFKQHLTLTDWNVVFNSDSVQESYNNFSYLFFNLYDLHFPIQRIKSNKNFHKLEKWMSSGILTSGREKIHLCKLRISSPTPININNFKLYINLYNKVIERPKKFTMNRNCNRTNQI
jgi:hypothetical protein